MSRHSFRWEGLAFGLFFLAVIGNWAVWKQDLMTPRQLGLTASGVLVVLGVLGVAATVWQTRSHRPVPRAAAQTPASPTDTPTEGTGDEEAPSQH